MMPDPAGATQESAIEFAPPVAVKPVGGSDGPHARPHRAILEHAIGAPLPVAAPAQAGVATSRELGGGLRRSRTGGGTGPGYKVQDSDENEV